jgi:hypothetical protein
MADYDVEDLPPQSLTVNDCVWRRERVGDDEYQWIRELGDEEYDWSPEDDDVSLVGTDVPIRVVSLRRDGDEWLVEGLETAGPDYHRPGFTEVISPEYSAAFPVETERKAFDRVREYVQKLS